MISFLARQLPRTAASALSSPVTRTSQSLSTVASTPVTLLTDRPRGGETSCRIKTRGPYGALFFSRTSSSLPSENDDAVLRRDAIAEIIAAEHELKLALSKKIVATVFDTIVESVAKKQTVQIAGFGKFEAVEVGPRVHTNPQDPNNKEARISKPPTTRAKFFPGKHFKDCVAGVVAVEKKTKQTSETV